MLLSPGKDGLTSLFKEVRVFKVWAFLNFSRVIKCILLLSDPISRDTAILSLGYPISRDTF